MIVPVDSGTFAGIFDEGTESPRCNDFLIWINSRKIFEAFDSNYWSLNNQQCFFGNIGRFFGGFGQLVHFAQLPLHGSDLIVGSGSLLQRSSGEVARCGIGAAQGAPLQEGSNKAQNPNSGDYPSGMLKAAGVPYERTILGILVILFGWLLFGRALQLLDKAHTQRRDMAASAPWGFVGSLFMLHGRVQDGLSKSAEGV